ncbi:aldehyde dehydrogenase family 3 member B1-like protein [Syncephalis pseudoplumigaleata]|uniref:Aldehyde dehydrogenase n=1 Tax=Syncephalis pseudoplumigaleata TaxID=1712513 RepID=A0A4P9YVT5_9FUNG|nr:aldehyde dehydrogenase family 3 member B1-like protein [Syncephalis pseudoplumigaleata]|eukprot:RKP23542.1 aldehyde dehydrogenase family 3 member B1-like protein [Syncephalis pseudoplumigaleata]
MTHDTLVYSTKEEIKQCTEDLAATFETGLTRPLSFRKQQLRQFVRLCDEQRDALLEAVQKDIGKHPYETMACELALVRDDAMRALDKLSSWAKPEYPSVRLTFALSRPHVRRVPYGMALIMGAWNYPLVLMLAPFVGAMAAGNTVVLKPSELAPYSARAITELLPRYLDQRAYRVVNGAVEESSQLLATKFDYIFYTGSGHVGRIVMQAAAQQLTPVTLELGGKSPLIIHRSCNLSVTANRLFFGKFLNCGQTCIAPDYVLCPRDLIEPLMVELRRCYKAFFDGNARRSECYGKIINERHFDRLMGLLEEDKASGCQVLLGGTSDREARYIEPTVILSNAKAALMRDEIFGPFMPIIEMDSVDEAISFVNRRDQPLTLYLFATDKKVIEKVRESTRSGAMLINDTMVHMAIAQLPFGGSGASGMGRYRGKAGFDTFSNQRAFVHNGYFDDPARHLLIYPPYNTKRIPLFLLALSRYSPWNMKFKNATLLVLVLVLLGAFAKVRGLF